MFKRLALLVGVVQMQVRFGHSNLLADRQDPIWHLPGSEDNVKSYRHFLTAGFLSGNGIASSEAYHDGDGIMDLHVDLEFDPYSAFDNQSFAQWFYFAVSPVLKKPIRVTIDNAGNASWSYGFYYYKARYSYNRKTWQEVQDTKFDGQRLVFTMTPIRDVVYFAYNPSYTSEDTVNFIAQLQDDYPDLVQAQVIGTSNNGEDIHLVNIGDEDAAKKKLWFLARIHPGESLSSHMMEGLAAALLDPSVYGASPEMAECRNKLLQEAVVYMIPNANPDGVNLGHHRTNAKGANLNRLWDAPTLDYTPELVWILRAMDARGVSFMMDVHQDEEEQHIYPDFPGYGLPFWNETWNKTATDLVNTWASVNPAFYPHDLIVNESFALCYSDSQVGSRFETITMTLEMPMTQSLEAPNPGQGWNGQQSFELGVSSIVPICGILDRLPVNRGPAAAHGKTGVHAGD